MLRIDNLTVTEGERNLIEQISITLPAGQLHGLVGPNGSGKSTLLKAIAGLWPHIQGESYWQEQRLYDLSRRDHSRICTLVPQYPTTAFDYTVQQIVSMGLYVHSDIEHPKSAVTNALKMTDAYHLRNRSINGISCGERQRAYIARALVSHAPVMLLDEPTSSLDIRHQLEIWELLKDLLTPESVILVAVHDLQLAQRYCDTITILDSGKLIGSGPYDQVVTNEALFNTFGVEFLHDSPIKNFQLAKN